MKDLKERAVRGGLARLCGQAANLVLRLGFMVIWRACWIRRSSDMRTAFSNDSNHVRRLDSPLLEWIVDILVIVHWNTSFTK